MALRGQLVKREEQAHFDAGVVLNPKEIAVDWALKEWRRALEDQGEGIVASNFGEVKDEMAGTGLFKVLKKMPKGGILHTHAFGSAKTLVDIGTYDPECWINVGPGSPDVLPYGFSYSPVKPPESTGVQWRNVMTWRNETNNNALFDQFLFNLTQFTTPPYSTLEDNMWKDFNLRIARTSTLASKEAVWRSWILSSLDDLVGDGVIHIEVRGFMNFIRLPGSSIKKYNDSQIIAVWDSLLADFNADLPVEDQISILFIYSIDRQLAVGPVYQYLLNTVALQQDPNVGKYVVGFDLVNEEYAFHSLLFYLQDWMAIKDYLEANNLPPMKYYFHSGETAWDKYSSENLFDAVMLNTSRVGHGFALRHFSTLISMMKQKGIAVEVNPISNQMLRLVEDMRDHSAVDLLNRGVAVVISSDDPVVFGNTGLTFDFWESYVAWNLTLSGLKKLTQNSIQYSALDDQSKTLKMSSLATKWDNWINSVFSSINSLQY
eukprot:TRINITY_DN120_c0_g1_i1.p1 TRINITY_DN120_c0_g1~~TRINITY_DN120_c0_g1_i1.p1  ORF type:complete len:489 (-),score=88.08 TRINITY_DN120_c0_g1_i1:19-1485(-)